MTNQHRVGNHTAIRASDAIFSAIRCFFCHSERRRREPAPCPNDAIQNKRSFFLFDRAMACAIRPSGRAMACAIRPSGRAMPAAYALWARYGLFAHTRAGAAAMLALWPPRSNPRRYPNRRVRSRRVRATHASEASILRFGARRQPLNLAREMPAKFALPTQFQGMFRIFSAPAGATPSSRRRCRRA